MRTNLQGLTGRRETAVFRQYGACRGRGCAGRSILLGQICDLADRARINYTAGFDAVGDLRRGDIVRFTAATDGYVKGYRGEKIDDRLMRPPAVDYRLKFPCRAERIGGAPSPEAR